MLEKIIKNIFESRKMEVKVGIASYCISNYFAVKSVLLHYKGKSVPVLFEATSNQVNQYGGYTGMTPEMYRKHIFEIASEVDFPKELIILGGDHLGPLPFCKEDADHAMSKAACMVEQYVKSGFQKIHLDTSMHLGGDDLSNDLSKELIAKRGAFLLKVALNAFEDYKLSNPKAQQPLFVIGSEVPPAGGQRCESEIVEITSVNQVSETLKAYDKAFKDEGLNDSWEKIIGLVIQPGVEYGGNEIVNYDVDKAKELKEFLSNKNGLVYEGHSTDYQRKNNLRSMVIDGVAILKVGPAITMALRESLMNLEKIEHYISIESENLSNFSLILDQVMDEDKKYWLNYYKGSEKDIFLAKKFSLLDRSRYYFGDKRVQESIKRLLTNLKEIKIHSGIVRQHFPLQFFRLDHTDFFAENLMNDYISVILEDYDYATSVKLVKE